MELESYQTIFKYHKEYCIDSNKNTIAFQPIGITVTEVCNSIAGFKKYQYKDEAIHLVSSNELIVYSQKDWQKYHKLLLQLIKQEILLLKLNLLSDEVF